MKRTFPLLAATVLMIVADVVHGTWTDRWGPSTERENAVKRLADVPLLIGDWDGQTREIDPSEFEVARIDGYLMRDYVNRRTGSHVSILLVCGRPGPVSVHTPDVCYRGAGYESVAAPAEYAVPLDSSEAHFWTAKFRKQESAVPVQLRVFWSWSADGQWAAPEKPRWTFARSRALYKLYVIRQLLPTEEPLAHDPAVEFMRALIPELKKALF